MAPMAVGAMKTTPVRWWNLGRFDEECTAFDVEHPLSRQVWTRLQQFRQDDMLWLATQPFGVKLPEPDATDEWSRIPYTAHIEYSYTGHNGVFNIP